MKNNTELNAMDSELLILKLDEKRVLKLTKPTVKMYLELCRFQETENESAASGAFDELIFHILQTNITGIRYTKSKVKNMDLRFKALLYNVYKIFLFKLITNGAIEAPRKPTEKNNGQAEFMPMIKHVIDYSGLNYYEVLHLPIDLFGLMHKNYIIDMCNMSEEGRKYLADCERYKKTKPDIEGLERVFGGKTNGA